MTELFAETARIYDLIYRNKDYEREAEILRARIHARNAAPKQTLLDVACGTGHHMESLRKHFRVSGLDICDQLLGVAQQRNPGVTFHSADMMDFDLGCEFDVVTCLFSSIGYVRTHEGLQDAMHCMVRHVKPGGLLVVEPWFTPGEWKVPNVHAHFIDEPERKIARISTSQVEDGASVFDLHYLIGTPQGTEHYVEHHEMGLFEIEDMQRAFREAGIDADYDPEGLTGRGLYIGTKR